MSEQSRFKFDVFLSHNSADKPRVRKLAERLKDAGLRVWFDEREIKPGDDIFLSIEDGVQNSRAMVLCLSDAALNSNWVALERSTVLFRDPTNKDRRFIPLLLTDCDPPDTIRRYRYVDYRQEAEESFKELLGAVQEEEHTPEEPKTIKTSKKKKPSPKVEIAEDSRQISVFEQKLMSSGKWIDSLSVSPDSRRFASVTADGIIIDIHSLEESRRLRSFKWKAMAESMVARAWCVEYSRAGELLLVGGQGKFIHIHNAHTGRRKRTLQTGLTNCKSIAWLKDDQRAVLVGNGGVLLIDTLSGQILRHYASDEVYTSVDLSRDERYILAGNASGKASIWSLQNGDKKTTYEGHSKRLNSVKFATNEKAAITASADSTVQIWDMMTGNCLKRLEGHSSHIQSVDTSPDGKLIATTGFIDQTVRIWDSFNGTCLQILEIEESAQSVCFTPDGKRLIAGTTDSGIFVWQIRPQYIPATQKITSEGRYTNAKIVLLGESGVGKSTLAHRLINDEYVKLDSTHGMNVWHLDLPEGKKNKDKLAIPTEREALLWDLAGQEDYRLIHQLFLSETALALVLINPQGDDPFANVGAWLKALRSAVTAGGNIEQKQEVARLLIAARTDVGSIRVSKEKIEEFVKDHGFLGYIDTSAKSGENCSDSLNGDKPSKLKELISKYVPWEQLPFTSTPKLLSMIKEAVLELREKHSIRLIRFAELGQRLEQKLPDQKFTDAEVRTAAKLLGNHGLVMPLKFGDIVLMRPELLNGYAGAVVRAARKHKDEIGCVREVDLFNNEIDFTGVDRLDYADEQLLLRALVQTLLDNSLCIAEDTPDGRHLVFPSQYNRPKPLPTKPEIFLTYSFSGELQTIYTTLVVGLWYSGTFDRKELWQNAAEFKNSKGKTLGLLLERIGEGEGQVSIFFDHEIPVEQKVVFIEYVHRHLQRRARDIVRDRRYICEHCGTPVLDKEMIRKRFNDGKDFISCQNCDKKVKLKDHIEQRLGSDPVAKAVIQMEQTERQARDTQAQEQILIGHMMAICGEANQIFRPTSMFDYGIDGEVEFKDDSGKASGQKIYVQLKSGPSHLRFRKSDETEVMDVRDARHLEYWIKQPVDVYLVVRGGDEEIRWMNVSEYLRKRKDKKSKQIHFTGIRLDAPAVWNVRDNFFPKNYRP